MIRAHRSLLVATLLACSSQSQVRENSAEGSQLIAAGASANTVSFAAMGPVVAAAAMRYPGVEVAEPEVPISLTASDGTGLELVNLDARAAIDGPQRPRAGCTGCRPACGF